MCVCVCGVNNYSVSARKYFTEISFSRRSEKSKNCGNTTAAMSFKRQYFCIIPLVVPSFYYIVERGLLRRLRRSRIRLKVSRDVRRARACVYRKSFPPEFNGIKGRVGSVGNENSVLQIVRNDSLAENCSLTSRRWYMYFLRGTNSVAATPFLLRALLRHHKYI